MASKKVSFEAAAVMALPRWDVKARTPSVQVTEGNLADLSPFVATDVGHSVWIDVASTWKGEACEAFITSQSSFERSDEAIGHPITPTAAVRLIQEVDGFENEAMRHVSLKATYAMLAAAKAAAINDMKAEAHCVGTPSVPPPPPGEEIPIPAHLFNDQSLLSRLEDFIDSTAFNSPLEAFAAEHAHKFKPLAPDDEHPLHYQELYLQFEAVLEVALEAFLSASGSSVAELVLVVSRAKERGDPLRCIDLLLASSEYSAFLELMMDYKFSMYIEGREVTPDSVVSQVSVVSPDRAAGAGAASQLHDHGDE